MGIVADLSRADILLYCRKSVGEFVVAAHAQPHSLAHVYNTNRSGTIISVKQRPEVDGNRMPAPRDNRGNANSNGSANGGDKRRGRGGRGGNGRNAEGNRPSPQGQAGAQGQGRPSGGGGRRRRSRGGPRQGGEPNGNRD